jgi:hypothetical protein
MLLAIRNGRYPSPFLIAASLALSLTFLAGRADAGTLKIGNFEGVSGTSDAAVQTFMQNQVNTWHPGGTVTVTGALVTGAGTSNPYNGDGHVVGKLVGNTVPSSYTLKTLDGGAFLINSGLDRIKMVFSFKIYSVSFDYEIFPDASSEKPDFTFLADGATILFKEGIQPGTPGGSAYTHSPISGTAPETTKQLVGSSSTLSFPGGVNTLEFVDWPPTIGISNLVLSDLPEPSSVVLLGCGFLGLAAWGWRKRALPAA